MKRSLRKGQDSVFLQYEHSGDMIGANMFESEMHEGVAILSFVLKPVDGNQSDDEARLHEEQLRSITLNDERVISRLVDFINANTVASIQVSITSLDKTLSYLVNVGRRDMDALTLDVVGGDS